MAEKRSLNISGLKLRKLPAEEKHGEVKEYKYDPRPEFTVEEKSLPEMKDWKPGEKYKMVVEVEMISYRSDKDKSCGCFRITSIGAA